MGAPDSGRADGRAGGRAGLFCIGLIIARCLMMHFAEVGFIGLMVVIMLTSFNGVIPSDDVSKNRVTLQRSCIICHRARSIPLDFSSLRAS